MYKWKKKLLVLNIVCIVFIKNWVFIIIKVINLNDIDLVSVC